jgi:glutamate racemase
MGNFSPPSLLPERPIGVFDSGVGGISVLKALRAELPLENFAYIADSGHAPYGERDDAHVIDRSQRVADWLVGQRAKALVVACNTATAAAIHLLRRRYPGLPIIGVEPALKPALALSQTKRIGVMATRGTLASRKFQALVAPLDSQADFVLQPCDGLADAIERSAAGGAGAQMLDACKRHTEAMGSFGANPGEIDVLVLGCTHYPFAGDTLQKLVGPDVQIVSNGDAIARQTLRLLPVLAGGPTPGEVRLFDTGGTGSLQAASVAWLGLKTTIIALHF